VDQASVAAWCWSKNQVHRSGPRRSSAASKLAVERSIGRRTRSAIHAVAARSGSGSRERSMTSNRLGACGSTVATGPASVTSNTARITSLASTTDWNAARKRSGSRAAEMSTRIAML
jgi:hypothetical protein